MPLDPNIILSGLQQQRGVDMNALLQQKISGMENINALERQRKSDELVMQDRAAKQAKEQEDAAVKALLPAYAYGFKNPTDVDGMLALVPPNMRENVMPYLDQIRGQSPDQVVAALTGSLVTSDVGRAFLENEARIRTAGIQGEQTKTAKERLAFDIAQANKPGAGDFIAVPTDQGVYLLNKKTGEYTPMLPSETGIPGPHAVPEDAAAAAPVPVTAAPATPGAAAGAPQSGILKPPPKAAEKQSEQEAKSMELAGQLAQANQITAELEAKGVRTSDAFVSFINGLFSSLPDAAGRNAADQLTALTENLLPNSVLTPEERRLARAQIQFVDAILRSRSGAEIKTSEFPSMYRVFFPTEADEGIPEIVNDKRISRELAVELMKGKSGPKGAETVDRLLREKGALPPAATPLTPGATLEGFEYQGVRK